MKIDLCVAYMLMLVSTTLILTLTLSMFERLALLVVIAAMAGCQKVWAKRGVQLLSGELPLHQNTTGRLIISSTLEHYR